MSVFARNPPPPRSASAAYVGLTVVTKLEYTMAPLSRHIRSGLCPMVLSSIAFSSVLKLSPCTPVAMNSSWRHSPVLSMLWIVSITLALCSIPSAW